MSDHDFPRIYRVLAWQQAAQMGHTKFYDLCRRGLGPKRREIDGLIYVVESPSEWLERVSTRAEHA